ncbi:hypothetical protein [Mucilaginibacter sp. 44-25]|uniref:hypothetical protein n=1 Tax=Mucilaginibacter sp. 44-25 TaxID=1895794 RepID=UPI0025FEBDD8|nr:hypothetical protein [Mucilaginibacter sp. 44-25]
MSSPAICNYPWNYASGTVAPRAIWNFGTDATVELWCVQDVVDPKWNSSSSQGKHEDLKQILAFSSLQPSLIIALGTAGYGTADNHIGCVVIGTNVFIHNFHPDHTNPLSDWDEPAVFGKLLPSALPASFFDLFNGIKTAIETGFLKPFLNPAPTIELLADTVNTALSVVNVTNYQEYDQSDKAGMDAVTGISPAPPVVSVETTHGIIRLLADCPFVFMSGITDRFLHFKDDVNGKDAQGNVKTEAQNYTAAFNIGVVVGNLLPLLPAWL